MGFNNCAIYTTTFTSGQDDFGGIIKGYKINDKAHMVEIQPITEQGYKYTWGTEITARLQIIDDVEPLFLKPKEIIVIDGLTYEIEKVIPWDTYSSYAVVEKEVKLL